MFNHFFHDIWNISKREVRLFVHRPMFLFCMIIAPVACIIFFTTLMNEGLPTNLPAGLVDMDNTHITRIVGRVLDSFQNTKIVARYSNVDDARKAMQQGKIYAFFYLPKGTTTDALANRQPKISFYTNLAYYVPGTLLMKDMKTASALTGLALTRETLYAKGFNEKRAMGIVQPIVIEPHAINNPSLNYSIYLCNIILPGILILLIFLTTAYSIGLEWKQNTQKRWFKMAHLSVRTALIGKLMPQTLLFSIIIIFYDVYFYKILQFPCLCGIGAMIGIGILTVLASQAFGVFLFGLFSGFMRLAMCLCSLWGILSFSLAGFTYPVMAMDPVLQVLANLFPLRHYYLLYVNQALDGNSIFYVWSSMAALLVFLLLPFLVTRRYHIAFDKYIYIP